MIFVDIFYTVDITLYRHFYSLCVFLKSNITPVTFSTPIKSYMGHTH